jgi:uncharacterized protein YqjF (DUF2071 family)
MKIPVLEFQSLRSYNREIFLIEHGDLVKTFVAIDINFDTLVQLPGTKRDHNGKSYVSLIPFVFLLQRQAQSLRSTGRFSVVSSLGAIETRN